MTAYLIVHRRNIRDSELLKDYAKGVDETILHFGGVVLVRADGYEVLEGRWEAGETADDSHPERITVIEFPDMERLKAWYKSDEYAPLRKIRQKAAVCDVAAVEGRV